MKQEVTETQKSTKYFCDICGASCHRSCHACGRDICANHRVSDDRTMSDYPSYYCVECWSVGRPYRDKQFTIQQETDDKIEQLEKDWYQLCKMHFKSKENSKESICPSCGKHKPNTIIINTTPESIATYQTWKASGTNLCFECFNKKEKKEYCHTCGAENIDKCTCSDQYH